MTVGGPDLLCVGSSKEAQDVLKRMEREATHGYQTLTLPEDQAANVLYLNGTLVHRSLEEIPHSSKVCILKVLWSLKSVIDFDFRSLGTKSTIPEDRSTSRSYRRAPAVSLRAAY